MLLALITSALAASNEVDLEVGWLGSGDTSFDRVSEANFFPTYGLRVGVKVHTNVAVLAGWQHGQAGNTIDTGGGDEDSYYSTDTASSSGAFRAAFYGDLFTLGAKGDVRVNDYFYPYITAQGALQRGLVRLDDNADNDDNIGQIQQAGLTGGVVAAVGAECPVALGSSGLALAPYVEFGYGYLAPLSLEELGRIKLGGFTGRAGFGLRF